MARSWVQAPSPLPPGVIRAWMAVENGVAVCGIFECVSPTGQGLIYRMAYHKFGDPRPTILDFNSVDAAMEDAKTRLNDVKIIPRAIPMMIRVPGHA